MGASSAGAPLLDPRRSRKIARSSVDGCVDTISIIDFVKRPEQKQLKESRGSPRIPSSSVSTEAKAKRSKVMDNQRCGSARPLHQAVLRQRIAKKRNGEDRLGIGDACFCG
ncbi:hypothetical protein Trydic_g19569 [Trypoxylus dichotomus]